MPGTRSGQLSPAARREALARMAAEQFDLVIIGGGVTGAGAALDAVTRGLSVALVEARDYSSGTSSRSSKLIHGGLRYLEQMNFTLVREALTERSLLLGRLAPHLVKKVPFLFPFNHHVWERLYLGSGLVLYDSIGGAGAVPRHRHLTRRQALRLAPALKKEALVGALQYYDAQVDDARLVSTLVRTAAYYGAAVASSAQVVGLLREGERVAGVRVKDLESGAESDVAGRQVINATGVWTDDIQGLVGGRGRFQVRASKGIHLVVPRDRIHADTGLILRTEKSVLFVIPWARHWLIGTTDTDWNLDKAHPAASAADIEYLLDYVNSVLRIPLSREDVEGTYAGLRPLLAGENEATSRLSREHAVAQPVAGLTVIAGGKFTTYRVMGKDAVDVATNALDGVSPSCTENVPLLGAEGYLACCNKRETIARQSGLHVARVEHLLNRYGSLIYELLDLIAAEPELAAPIEGADDYLKVEARYAASHEGALHLDDVLTRRTRIYMETWDRGLAAAPVVARLVAPVLGWQQADVDREVEYYRLRVKAERESQEKCDDLSADAARLGAPDVRMGSGAGRPLGGARLPVP
ncbi:MAG: glycerol-3-phosphate dehydrogenase/oxidase [Frankiaceae bacterium]